MAKILNFFRTIRNNWKKSVVGAAALSYGVSYSKELYDTEQLMREYCEDVKKYGDAPLPTNMRPRHVTVILNPAAKKRKTKKFFERYCEPLLHLAGIAVTIVQTESGTHARNIVINMDKPTDAIIVAGGDGTLSDVLTGLMRKYQADVNSVKQCPIGILPLGETNSVANTLYTEHSDLPEIRKMVDATMAVINEKTKMMDAVEIEVIENDPEDPMKPIYAMGSIEWGAWRDAQAVAKKYWYWGSLRKYITYVFSGYKTSLNWDCTATLKYTDPCNGCSACYQKNSVEPTRANRRWWHAFIPKRNTFVNEDTIDYSKVVNEKCGIFHEIPVSTTELRIETPNIHKSTGDTQSSKSLKLHLGPENVDYVSFVSEGWKHESQAKPLGNQVLEAKDIELIPQQVSPNRTLYIDNEGYELKAIKVKLLPRSVKVFCPEVGS